MARKRIGVALGGGGARGLAHIGVLKVLQENEIPIDFVSGTSMGAIIGALFCSGMSIKKIEKEILSINWKSVFDYTLPTRGLIKGKKIENLLREILGNLKFSDLIVPLKVTAYDIKNNQEIVFTKGNLIKALRASISIPGIFVPVSNNNRVLVDGGVVDPIPTEILEDNVDIIIGVNVSRIHRNKIVFDEEALEKDASIPIPSIFESTSRAIHILGAEVSKADLKGEETDLVIDIPLGDRGILDFKDISSIIKKGEETTKRLLKEIKRVSKPNILREFIYGLQGGLEKNVIGLSRVREGLKKSKDSSELN
jgi:NTE family protein